MKTRFKLAARFEPRDLLKFSRREPFFRHEGLPEEGYLNDSGGSGHRPLPVHLDERSMRDALHPQRGVVCGDLLQLGLAYRDRKKAGNLKLAADSTVYSPTE